MQQQRDVEFRVDTIFLKRFYFLICYLVCMYVEYRQIIGIQIRDHIGN